MAQANPIPSDESAGAGIESLVAHILDRYHRIHRAELPQLLVLARRVETTHRGHPRCPAGLTRFLERAGAALDDHMRKEEEILFPMMLSIPGNPMIRMPVAVMEAEHEEHLRTLAELGRLTGGLQAPEDACGSWHALYRGLEKFAGDLDAHIRLENDRLFPLAGGIA